MRHGSTSSRLAGVASNSLNARSKSDGNNSTTKHRMFGSVAQIRLHRHLDDLDIHARNSARVQAVAFKTETRFRTLSAQADPHWADALLHNMPLLLARQLRSNSADSRHRSQRCHRALLRDR